ASVWADQLNDRAARDRLYAEGKLHPALAANLALPGSGAVALVPAAADPAVLSRPNAKAHTQLWSAFGAILGTIVGALCCDWFGRRWAYTLLCAGSLASVLYFFQMNDHYGAPFLASAFVAGGLSPSFYRWVPPYPPGVVPAGGRP